jgi:hypothetical protein
LNGTTAAAQVPPTTALNLTNDWTIEAWFKDEDPRGFNHGYAGLLYKGDRDRDPEAPYFLEVGFKRLQAGLRSGWTDYSVQYELSSTVDPKRWHHAAATFRVSTRTLTLYLDGLPVAQTRVARASRGNTRPLELGRIGVQSGKYLRGKLDDVRVWNVVRTPAQIAANYRTEPDTSVEFSGLVANWTFNEASGTQADDARGGPPARLSGGAGFATDVHP